MWLHYPHPTFRGPLYGRDEQLMIDLCQPRLPAGCTVYLRVQVNAAIRTVYLEERV